MGHVEYKKQHTVKDAFHVDIEDIVPSLLLGKVEERSTPCNARVVDQNVQFAFPFTELGDESIAPCF